MPGMFPGPRALTCGTRSPNTFCAADMPARPGGLCSGASMAACNSFRHSIYGELMTRDQRVVRRPQPRRACSGTTACWRLLRLRFGLWSCMRRWRSRMAGCTAARLLQQKRAAGAGFQRPTCSIFPITLSSRSTAFAMSRPCTMRWPTAATWGRGQADM